MQSINPNSAAVEHAENAEQKLHLSLFYSYNMYYSQHFDSGSFLRPRCASFYIQCGLSKGKQKAPEGNTAD